MDDRRLGAAFRALRIRARRTQQEIGAAAGVSAATVSRVERGHIRTLAFGTTRAVASALDATLDLDLHWRGGQLDRLLDARHAALQQVVARRLSRAPGWTVVPEASFSVFGERGSIDLLAWHEGRRALLVIEIKSQLVDLQALLRAMDQRRRLAPALARDRGWRPGIVSTWVVLEDTDANRRRARAREQLLALAFPSTGSAMRAWLRDPRSSIHALSFAAIERRGNRTWVLGTPQRVRRPQKAAVRAEIGAAAAPIPADEGPLST